MTSGVEILAYCCVLALGCVGMLEIARDQGWILS